MKINTNKKIFYIYILALMGFFLILYYIWYRFIRARLPRNIPFDLTILGFISLCIICIIYVYIIYRIYKPAKTPNIFLCMLYPYIQIIFKPFYFFDILLRRLTFFKEIFIKLFFKFIVIFKLYITKRNEYLFVFFNIIPKICLLFSFLLDIFYFNKLHYFYFALSLNLLPLCYTYIIHLLTQYLNNISNYLDKHYTVVILSTKEEEKEYNDNHDDMCFFISLRSLLYKYNDDDTLDSKIFIDYQSNNLIFDKQLYKYTCIETWFARDMYIKKHNITRPLLWIFLPESDEISKALIGKFKEFMPQAYYFKAFVDTHNELVKVRERYLTFNKVILVIYLLCWVYILFVSIHTLDFNVIIKILSTIKTYEDPFLMLPLEPFYPSYNLGPIIFFKICILFSYIVWTYIRKSKKIAETIVNFLLKPLNTLDNFIKNISIIKTYYPKILIWISQKYLKIFQTLIFETYFFIIPHLVLISVFIIDIFYFSKLHYIYYVFVPMGIILFLRRYYIYSIKNFETTLVNYFKLYVEDIITDYKFGIHPSEWPENFDPDDDDEDEYDIPPTMSLNVEIFIDYHYKKILNEETPPEIISLYKTNLFYTLYNEKNYDIYKKKPKNTK